MFGIYIHWPFCLSKCIYCDFGSKIINSNVDQNSYFECCRKQLEYFHEKIANRNVVITSIYFGGGTPSILDPEIIAKLIVEIRHLYTVSSDCEITLEANPTSSGIKKFEMLYNAGINRLSIGVQSFDDNELWFLGRKHNVKEALQTINYAKQIFPRWSIDLIYGLPKQKQNKWLEELEIATTLNPQHISLYTLIVDESTPLGKLVKSGNVKPKSEDELSCFYDITNEFLEKNTRLKQYEVSNYAIKGQESRHNLTYWKSYDYIGIGAGAHGRLLYKKYNDKNNNSIASKIDNSKSNKVAKNRFDRYEIKNIFDYFEWQKCCQNNNKESNCENAYKNTHNKRYDNSEYGIEIEKKLTKKKQAEEILLMGLRTKDGIDVDDIKTRFNINLLDFLDIKKVEKLKIKKMLSFDSKTLALTEKGLKILDAILLEIIK